MARAAKEPQEKKAKGIAKASKAIKKAEIGKTENIAAAVPVLSHSASKGSKKEAVSPVKAAALSRSASKASKTLELCLLLDITSSM